jgi:hypothetical protein
MDGDEMRTAPPTDRETRSAQADDRLDRRALRSSTEQITGSIAPE